MGQVDQAFFPPRHWQQFEELTLGCFREILRDQHAARNGRSGFPQFGVDVYGDGPDGFTGIQCKQIAPINPSDPPLPGGKLTRTQLKTEISKAEKFEPPLKVFIMATTASTAPKLQAFVRELNIERRQQRKFRVILWFWEDYLTFLNTSYRLCKWFYQDVLRILDRQDEDLAILRFLADAFARPAFEHPLSVEDFDAFPQAIEDTQTALRTGALYDRRTRTLIRQSLSWRRVTNPVWRDGLKAVDQSISDLRLKILEGVASDDIVQKGRFMEIRDPHLRDHLEDLRRSSVSELNRVLSLAGLQTV